MTERRYNVRRRISMALTIVSREVDGVSILDLKGRITLGEGSVQIRDAVYDLIGKGQKSILLNLGDVNYIDSSGLGELVSAFVAAKNRGAELKLLKLTRKIHDLLQLTKLCTVFDIYDDEAVAIASFK
jgi:anti-sigma B factor antagonist